MHTPDSIRAAKLGYFVISAMLCALGLFLILFPGTSVYVLCSILGAVMVVYGIVKMVGYFSRDLYRLAFQYDLAGGIVLIVIGLMLLIRPTLVIAFLFFVFGVLILADGLFKIQIALDARRFGIRKWWLLLAAAVLAGVLGLALVLHPAEGAGALMVLFGLALLADGILGLLVALYAVEMIRH